MKTYKSTIVLAEIKAMSGMVIENNTYTRWRRFFNIVNRERYLTAEQFLNLMSLAMYRKENPVLHNFDDIEEQNLYEMILKYDLEQRLKDFDTRGINRRDLIIDFAKKYNVDINDVRKLSLILHGAAKEKTLLDCGEVIEFENRVRCLSEIRRQKRSLVRQEKTLFKP